METKRKQQKKPKIVTKPFLRGAATDSHLAMNSLKFFGALALMSVAFLLLGSMLMLDSAVLRLLINAAIMICVYLLFYNSGLGKGAAAVNLGEMLHMRRENGHAVSQADERSCFHPAKGFIIAVIGTLPFILCGCLLAATAQIQMTGLSTLPSWLESFERRAEVGNALAYYHETASMGVEDVTRLVVRMSLMPVVGMIGTENTAELLMMERLSPLAMLLPALFYGIGYTRGVTVRTKIHTSIASNNRKRAKQEKKKQQARARRSPEKLN